MSKKELKVCWLSAGVSSFVAGYLKKDSIDLYIYIDIENQHPDSMRFIKDCEKILGKEILILKSPYRNKENVIRQFRYINGPSGAKCTEILKKRVRKEWEMEHREYQITYVWGFGMDERRRAERICEAMRYNPNMDDMETDHDKYIHYEINFEEKDWKERFLEKMGMVLLNYYSEECSC